MLTRNSSEAITPELMARTGFMRFGLGPKPNWKTRVFKDQPLTNRSLLDLCLKEVDTPNIAMMPEDILLRGSRTAKFKVRQHYEGELLRVVVSPEEISLSAADRTLPDYAAACRAVGGPNSGAQTALIRGIEHWARYTKHLHPEVGFVERLVMFWSNHFSISQLKNFQVGSTVGHFERSVIREHVLGRFPDMLKAAIQHPAMLHYLDNINSIGNNSVEAARRLNWQPDRFSPPFFNENLAREILELHTLGVGGGYTQQDVTNLAKILTGWTIYPQWLVTNVTLDARRGQFQFREEHHEPGEFSVLDRSFPQNGMKQALDVMDMLALHPKTA